MIGQGRVPYRDFFEHHTPLFHFLGSSLFLVGGDSDLNFVLAAFRSISVLFSVGTVFLTWQLAKRCGSPLAPVLATILLIGSRPFLQNGIEIRPDPLATFAVVSAFICLDRAFMAERRAVLWAALSGLAISIAVFTSQKSLFVVPGLLVCWIGLGRQLPVRARARLAAMALAGAVIPAAGLLWYFQQEGALSAFIYDNFLLNAQWPRDGFVSQIHWARVEAESDTLLIGSALVGCVILGAQILREGRLAVVAPLVSLGLGFLIIPVVQPQYFLMALPFAAVAGGVGLERLIGGCRDRSLMGAGIVLLLASLTTGANLHRAFAGFDQHFEAGNDALVRAKLAYIIEHIPADATIMSGWSSGVALRPPAFRYGFLHPEIQAIISPAAYAGLADGLRNGRIAPAAVDLDPFVLGLPEPIPSYLLAHYRLVGLGTLAVRSVQP
jgi:4-amino-4-deoxy-L-arabinose transferase-like glycosyltransferase